MRRRCICCREEEKRGSQSTVHQGVVSLESVAAGDARGSRTRKREENKKRRGKDESEEQQPLFLSSCSVCLWFQSLEDARKTRDPPSF